MTSTRVAVVQAAPVLFDVTGTLAKMSELAADTARQGAKLAVFPEAFVSAYPKGIGFGAGLSRQLMGSRIRSGPEVLTCSLTSATRSSTA